MWVRLNEGAPNVRRYNLHPICRPSPAIKELHFKMQHTERIDQAVQVLRADEVLERRSRYCHLVEVKPIGNPILEQALRVAEHLLVADRGPLPRR